MKLITKTVLVAGAAVLMAMPLFAKSHGGTKKVKDSLHFSIKESFTNNQVEAGAKGTVTATQTEQGNANKESMKVTLSGLTASNTYSLVAVTSDNPTNTDVFDFSTDSKGRANLNFSNSAKGKKNIALPAGLDPVSHVLELDVVNGDGVSVLTADLTNPQSLKYMVTRDISAGGVTSSLSIKSTKGQNLFHLTASGLDPSTDYILVINGSSTQTVTSDANGDLNITSAPLPANILDLNSVALTDTSNNVIVSTTLP